MCCFLLLSQNTIRNREGSAVTASQCTWSLYQVLGVGVSKGSPRASHSLRASRATQTVRALPAMQEPSFRMGLSALYQLAGTIAARPVKVWEHCRAGWLLGDAGATDCFPPTPPTALAAGKASWGVSSQQLPAGPATTSNPQDRTECSAQPGFSRLCLPTAI